MLLIVVDDLNDWNQLLDETSPIKTPNLIGLAGAGTLFTRAYCTSPACNPSRTSIFTGLRPTTSGVYGNRSDWRRALPERLTIMQVFRQAGYSVFGAGKIFHHHLNGAFHDEDSFDEFLPMRAQSYPEHKLNHAPEYGSRNTDWGTWPLEIEDSIDFQTADYGTRILSSEHERPFFLACGIFKPHSPFFAPPGFEYPNHHWTGPPVLKSDWGDLPSGASSLLRSKRWFWEGMQVLEHRLPGSLTDFQRAYAACVTFADAQIGKLIEALNKGPNSEDTIVVLFSDHGFHLGEKDHFEKFALWEKTNRVPLIFVVPELGEEDATSDAAAQICSRPVDLSAVYPTLLELCNLPPDSACDGQSLVPLLSSPESLWSIPAIMSYQPGNHAIRSQNFRFIQYADGTEELYDHRSDPAEWTNLATNSEYSSVLEMHRKWLPASQAAPVADLKRNKLPSR